MANEVTDMPETGYFCSNDKMKEETEKANKAKINELADQIKRLNDAIALIEEEEDDLTHAGKLLALDLEEKDSDWKGNTEELFASYLRTVFGNIKAGVRDNGRLEAPCDKLRDEVRQLKKQLTNGDVFDII